MDAAQPSFTAMVHAFLRASHTRYHQPPVYSDVLSVRLLPQETLVAIEARRSGFTKVALDAMMALAVVRYRVVADRLESAHERGVRQLVILGAGLDTTAFQLPEWAGEWKVFEVDHPSTQEWKRRRIAEAGWEDTGNLVFSPCDFEHDDLLTSLESAGFQRDRPAVVTWFGVILYLTAEATRATLGDLGSLAPGSELALTYSEPPDFSYEAVREFFEKTQPIVDASGESYVGFYTEREMDALVRAAGFTELDHHPIERLNEKYFLGCSDGLRLSPIDRLLTAIRGG